MNIPVQCTVLAFFGDLFFGKEVPLYKLFFRKIKGLEGSFILSGLKIRALIKKKQFEITKIVTFKT